MTLRGLLASAGREVAEEVALAVRATWPSCLMSVAADREAALRAFADHQPDLVIVDTALPPNGFEICRRIRASSRVPILMLSPSDTVIEKIRALDLGADYTTFPFDHLEMRARLRALVRRFSRPGCDPELRFVAGDLAIDFAKRELRRGGKTVPLTPIESRLLAELVRHAGKTIPHHVLLERVWGSSWQTNPGYLKVFVRRLRRKLGDAAECPCFIQTDWGVGYRFVVDG
ncbi:MAG: response regulator transcription factor [Chloroflexia bacterium]|nr:response regulator transcription factor [Chloroflexia bacterium]